MSVKASRILKTYHSGTQDVVALDSVSFKIRSGSFTVVLGPSGSGKSTLFNIIAGIDSFDSGSIDVDGHKLEKLKARQLDAYRKNTVGMVFQGYNLLNDLTVYENVKLVADMSSDSFPVEEVLERLSISDLKDRFPYELSGGQQQRVAIARAVVAGPKLILADEPTGNLDSKNGKEVMDLLTELNQEGTTIVMVTHSQKDAAVAQRTIDLFDGQIVSDVKNEL
jgi:putative ABC transport system ATP-binding protein